jgi:hypothetical protein
MINQHGYIVALSHQLAHPLILLYCCAASCGEMPSFDYKYPVGNILDELKRILDRLSILRIIGAINKFKQQ